MRQIGKPTYVLIFDENWRFLQNLMIYIIYKSLTWITYRIFILDDWLEKTSSKVCSARVLLTKCNENSLIQLSACVYDLLMTSSTETLCKWSISFLTDFQMGVMIRKSRNWFQLNFKVLSRVNPFLRKFVHLSLRRSAETFYQIFSQVTENF